MRPALAIIAALGLSCGKSGGGGEGEPKSIFDKAAEVVAAAEVPRSGIFVDGVAQPSWSSRTDKLVGLLEVRQTAAVAAATPTGTDPPIPRGFVAPPPIEDKGDFVLVVAGDADHPAPQQRAAMAAWMKGVVELLNGVLKLERDVPIVLEGCGEPNMYYSLEDQKIIICDEIVGFTSAVFTRHRDAESAQIATVIALLGGLFHELGHALIHQYDLPNAGNEEDVADRLAALLMLGGPQVPDDQRDPQFALYSAEFWMAMAISRGQQDERLRYSDEHALDDVRYYNILCLAYGVAPDEHAWLVDEGDLPRSRATRCKREYMQAHSAWKKLLSSYLQDGEQF